MAVAPKPKIWSVADAKAHFHFSEVSERARHEGPQTITRNGKKAVVVVSADEWGQHTAPQEALSKFFRRSPLFDSGINLERVRSEPRDVEP